MLQLQSRGVRSFSVKFDLAEVKAYVKSNKELMPRCWQP